MKLLLTGATGTAGSEALRQALADPEVTAVTTITRRALSVEHPKLRSLELKDFTNYASIQTQLAGHDACLWLLGIAQSKVTEAEYRTITLEYTVAGARAMKEANPELTFCFLSGQGTDPSGKSWMLFARVKGEAERALEGMNLRRLHHFRPGYIRPVHPDSITVADRIASPFASFAGLLSSSVSSTTVQLAHAMIHTAKHGAPKLVLENKDILELAGQH